jgi:hypothetical protein
VKAGERSQVGADDIPKQLLSPQKRNTNFVIPTGADPDFLSRCTRQIHVCAFP